ncbi:MAG TPA: HDOD domain-containing protein, partial [Rhodocyclaceae bacterium]|nr:HDOD domain-containing protein [Rhodocyclaceae bacterium]
MSLATRMALVLTGVNSRADFYWAVANSAQMMSGEYILQRSQQSSGKPDITRVRLLKLLSLVSQDAETKEIEEIFRQEPKLSYSLMRLVNSAALNLRGSVTSYSQ